MATTKKALPVSETETVIASIVPSSVQADFDWQEVRKKEAKETQDRLFKMHQDLSEQFPVEVERQLKKGGAQLTYIPVSEVINRLNKVLGFTGWSYEIIKCERDSLDPDFIVAHVRLTVFTETDRYVTVTKDGFGGQKIKRTKQGDIVDLGDEFKGAVSDALKKAAQALGVGLYLARTEEAMESEAIASEPPISPEIAELWDTFIDLSKSLNPDGKSKLNEFWSTYANGKPKPTKQTATVKDLNELIAECIQISVSSAE